jgi:hypothetical protein
MPGHALIPSSASRITKLSGIRQRVIHRLRSTSQSTVAQEQIGKL